MVCDNRECVIKVIVASVTKTGHKISNINSLLSFYTGGSSIDFLLKPFYFSNQEDVVVKMNDSKLIQRRQDIEMPKSQATNQPILSLCILFKNTNRTIMSHTVDLLLCYNTIHSYI